MTHDEMIAVIQAHKEGKELQARAKGCKKWHNMVLSPEFNFGAAEYRIKPAPRVLYVNEYADHTASHDTEHLAARAACTGVLRVGVKYVEVLEE